MLISVVTGVLFISLQVCGGKERLYDGFFLCMCVNMFLFPSLSLTYQILMILSDGNYEALPINSRQVIGRWLISDR